MSSYSHHFAAAVDELAEECAAYFFALTAGCPDDAAPVLRMIVWNDMSGKIARTVTDMCASQGMGYLPTQTAIDAAQARYAAIVNGRTLH